MSFHDHLKTVHHHARRAGRGFLTKAAEHHPILVPVLALFGAGTIFYKLSSKPAAGVQGTGGTV